MSGNRFRLVSWNIGGRVRANRRQAEVLKSCNADVVALQEVRVSSMRNFERILPELGLPYMEETTHLAEQYDRRYGVLFASRWPLKRISSIETKVPYPERVLSVMIDSPWGELELHTAHIVPGSSRGWKKIEMFEGIYQCLAHYSDNLRILCGDFNAPQAETSNGRIITWGQNMRAGGEIEIYKGYERWDSGERSVLEDLAEYDLADVFRRLNGYNVEGYSWFMKRKGEVTVKRRFDHIFASRALRAVECRYLEHVVKQDLSDHAAIEAVFEPNVQMKI